MAQYKVPQDVEAEDKLLGPFTFRQFIYLVVAAAAVAMAWALFQVFPLLAVIPLPVFVLFAVLALPLKKDQPMETYLAAIVSFYLKPRNHFWIPGQRESTITITAPKKVESPRARNITEEEAGHRLSFLADLIDTEGYSIKNVDTAVRDEYIAEANAATDILDFDSNTSMNQMINQESAERREEVMNQMRSAMNNPAPAPTTPQQPLMNQAAFQQSQAVLPQVQQPANRSLRTPEEIANSPVTVQPDLHKEPEPPKEEESNPTHKAALENLAANKDYSIETLAKEAKRIKEKDDDEVYISLH